MSAAQFNAKFRECENNLSTDLRETWNLRKDGFDYQEIADRLSIPLGTVKSRFHRLTLILRKELGHELE